MTLLPMFFFAMFFLSAAAVMAATRPSMAERQIRLRVADIRNPRRLPGSEESAVELADAESGTLSQRLGRYVQQYSYSAKLECLLLEADSEQTVGSLVLKSGGCFIASGLAAMLLTGSLMMCAGLGLVGLTLPVMTLRFRRARRVKAVTAALADTADLLARALRAGHSMTQAIEVLAERAPEPLAGEFARVFQRQKLGVALREVLLELSRRIPVKDLHFLITAILVQRDTGGDLAEILDRTSRTLRERIRVEGEVRVQTAQGRLTGWILSLLPLCLLGLISAFSPGYCSILFTDPVGRMLIYGGAGCILLGALVIRQIVKVNF